MYRGRFTYESRAVCSSFDSYPNYGSFSLTDNASYFIFFESKLLMFISRKWKPFLLSGSHIVEFISRDLRIGPGFILISPDKNKRNLQKLV